MSLMQLTKELCQHDDCWNPAVSRKSTVETASYSRRADAPPRAGGLLGHISRCRHSHNVSQSQVNIRIGAEYFKKELDSAGGNFLKAAAAYNGEWSQTVMLMRGEQLH